MYLKKISLLILLYFSNLSYSITPNVNLLVWYGYFDDPPGAEKIIEKKCNVHFTHDIYYTNDEILNRVKQNGISQYDLIIFSDTIYNSIIQYIPKHAGDLSNQTKKYNNEIRKHYINEHYPKNIVYFLHSLTGFLYNPAVLSINSNDSLLTIFKKAKNNIMIMLDDPVEVWNLIKVSRGNMNDSDKSPSFILNVKNFKTLVQNADIYIANNDNKLYDQKNFAGGFLWTGSFDAYLSNSTRHFKLYLSPKISYISTDLLAAINDRPQTKCVANEIMSREILKFTQKDTQYFSPFGHSYEIRNGVYKKIYGNPLSKLDKLKWLPRVSKSEYTELRNNWSDIQIQIQKERNEKSQKYQ